MLNAIKCYSLTITLLVCFNLSAQYSANTFMISFESGTTQDEINQALADLNSTELWVSPISSTRLWEVNSFPFFYPPTSTWVTNINETDEQAHGRARTNGGGLNFTAASIFSTSVPPPGGGYRDDQMDCQGQLSTYADNNVVDVGIGVFDTGLEYDPTVNHVDYYFDLEGYSQYDHLDNDYYAQDDNGHGTHMASIISHTINKAYGTQSTSEEPNEYYDIRKTFDADGIGYIAEIILAMEESTIQGMKIANCSWSFVATNEDAYESPLYTSLSLLESVYGVLIIAAAGNNAIDLDHQQNYNYQNYPAAYTLPNILSATSYDCTSELADFANYGVNSVDIALPGYSIPGLSVDGNLISDSGTSHSTAILTGVAATLATHQSVFDYADIICAIMESAVAKPQLHGKIKSGGVIDAQTALTILGDCNTGNNNPLDGRSRISTAILPNPNTGQFIIEYNSESDNKVELSVLDLQGKLVYKKQTLVNKGLNTLGSEINLQEPGFYTLILGTPTAIESHKLVIRN